MEGDSITKASSKIMFQGEKMVEPEIFYHMHSTMQQSVIAKHTPLLVAFLDISTWKSKPDLFTICDFGTADGHNSTELLRQVIAAINNHFETNVPFHIIYNDKPENDFRPIFHSPGEHSVNVADRNIPGTLQRIPNVFQLSVGKCFYNQCLAANSVDLAICFTSIHWLSLVPCHLVADLVVQHSEDEQERERFRMQAATDWEDFLIHRATELKPGGLLFMNIPCMNDDHEIGFNCEGDGNTYLSLRNVIREMVRLDLLTELEMARIVITCYHRTKEEIEQPFLGSDTAVSKAGLKLEGLELVTTDCPLNLKEHTGSAEELDAKIDVFVGIVEGFTGMYFREALNADRSEEQKKEIFNTVYSLFQDAVRKNPENFSCATVSYAVCIKKSL